MPRLKARLFSAPCRSRLISELKQACRGQHLSSPTLVFFHPLNTNHDVEQRHQRSFSVLLSLRLPSVSHPRRSPGEQKEADCVGFPRPRRRNRVEKRKQGPGRYLGEKSRWMTIVAGNRLGVLISFSETAFVPLSREVSSDGLGDTRSTRIRDDLRDSSSNRVFIIVTKKLSNKERRRVIQARANGLKSRGSFHAMTGPESLVFNVNSQIGEGQGNQLTANE